MKKRLFIVATAAGALLAFSGCSTTTSSASPTTPAEERASINAGVDKALASLYAQVNGSRELVSKAKGVLVFPSVISAGFGIGGTYGKGALRAHGVTTGYYSTAAASVGLIAGAESKAMYILFMTQDALDKFQASKGWTAGVDASVTALSVGADAGVTTQTAQQPVVGYVLTNGGLMANLSFDGTKFTRLDL
jgi:lipid-binding SYLF domain-containing protein